MITAFGFSEETVHSFTNGDCYELAVSLHERTGYPIVGILGEDEDGPDSVMHAAVELPDGTVVDIEGIWKVEDFIPRWYNELEHTYGLDYNDDIDPESISEFMAPTEARYKYSYTEPEGKITHGEIVDRILAKIEAYLGSTMN